MAKQRKETFSRWNTADHLHSEADMAGYLQACRDEAPGDDALMAKALEDCERARVANANRRPFRRVAGRMVIASARGRYRR